MNITEEFIQSSKYLHEKHCWSITGGEGTGSVIGIDCGEKIPRKKKLVNPHLTDEQRLYKSELSLLIWSAWRLDSENGVICSSTDDNSNNGPMITGLKQLIGKKIRNVSIATPMHDMTILFDEGYVLNIFCDQCENENYSFFTTSKIYTVEAKGEISAEEQDFTCSGPAT